ncbi:hypothetical protein [Rouxiella badensis]|uniref:hypothetical protein n=1 Tax=Rouxiella badensis TaxID=1646377 RepID=UPI00178836B5|nr:hypothetical protein [Rouxiella badensis]QOI56216.1 hypothetical protein H2866_03430 [Rouxiella badensis subsp. acadiensis]
MEQLKEMSFKDFAVDWRIKAKIASNNAARFFNMNPQQDRHGEEVGRANREMILFRANRIAIREGKEKPFRENDADKNFVDFTEEQRIFIIDALNEISHFGKNLPSYIPIADCRINI